jgi:UDP-perosamine 4-acetyltransferase
MNSGVVVIGAGGHAKVCIEIFQAMGEVVSFCVGGADSPQYCIGIPVLHGDENLGALRSQGYHRTFIALGPNKLRKRLSEKAVDLGYELVNAISPYAAISPTCKIGRGVAVMAGAVINSEAVIGDLAIINTGATIDHDCRIGRSVHIGPQCALAGNVFVDDHSFLGVGCRVIPGIKIGNNTIVGAGSVVISDIESNKTAVGIPAKVIKSLDAKAE